MNPLKYLLLPFSLLYWIAIRTRNYLFDRNILKGFGPDLPTICVGNLTVGGTGKTPVSEYLVELLMPHFPTGFLSRGYKRKSKGFRIVECSSLPAEVGDEPLQLKQKYPDVTAAVSEDRVMGIVNLLAYKPNLRVIVLDDAFQHRWVKPGYNILLTDYNNLYTRDLPLPAGRLRDTVSESKRADIIIVTKCPPSLPEETRKELAAELRLHPRQTVYFATIQYGEPVPVFDGPLPPATEIIKQKIVAIAGIANPKPFFNHLTREYTVIGTRSFADHHHFSSNEIYTIFEKTFGSTTDGIAVTTEKDATKIRTLNLSEAIRSRIFYIPIRVKFLNNQTEQFNKQIISYVGENKPDGNLHQG